MKRNIVFPFLVLLTASGIAQPQKITHPLTPCNGTADAEAGIYTDHTNPKYGSHSIKGGATEKATMTKNLIAIEKLEEASRKDFKLTGCAARVSFSGGDKNRYGAYVYNTYHLWLSTWSISIRLPCKGTRNQNSE